MAEVGLIASLVSIAGAAVQLTRTLYVFGSTTSAAREHVDHIAKNVSFYSDVLELLVEQFDNDRPIHSTKAVALAEKLYDHSYDLFGRIRDLIPRGYRNGDQISFLQRIAWNFKKTKVDVLVGELESLKSTVQLLVQVLCAARQLRAYKEDIRKPREKKHKHSTVKRQCLRAENVIIEWQQAQEMLPALQEAAEKDDIRSIEARPGSTVPHESSKWRSSSALMKNQETTLAVINAAAIGASGSKSEKRALALRNTDNWLNQLLSEWTVLSGEAPEIKRDLCQNTPEELSHEGQSWVPNIEASEHGGKDHHPAKANAKSGRNVGDLDVRIKRAEEELAKLRQEERVSSLLGLDPSDSYFEEDYHYWEKEPRTTSEKYDVFEPERRPYVREPEKERKSTKWPEKAANDLPFNLAVKLQKAKEGAKQSMQEKETTDKQSNRRACIEDDSGSDSDAAINATIDLSLPQTSKSAYNLPSQTKLKPERRRRPTSRREKEVDKWQAIHRRAKEYVERSQGAGLSGRTSSSRSYW